jgi:hypothetical protein
VHHVRSTILKDSNIKTFCYCMYLCNTSRSQTSCLRYFLLDDTLCSVYSPSPYNCKVNLICNGFESLTVPMHLGLIDRPFVPQNLISARDSPVPLPKFQMVPRRYPLAPELNPSAQRCLTRFLLGILLLEPCISLLYA